MSVKKNLTVATLAALLAIPAFEATNASQALHTPSVTAHADSGYYGAVHTNNLIHGITINGHYWPAGTPIYGSHDGSRIGKKGYMTGYFGTPGNDGGKNDYIVPKSYLDNVDSGNTRDSTSATPSMNQEQAVSSAIINNGGHVQGPNFLLNKNGHQFLETAGGFYIDGNRVSFSQMMSALNIGTSNNDTNYNNTNTNSNKLESNSSNNYNGSTQYASKNSLPQTDESNGASKAMAMGAVALGASASMMALSVAKKHKRDAEVNLTVSNKPSVSNNDKPNEDKSGYHMIMSDTFANISKDLKQM